MWCLQISATPETPLPLSQSKMGLLVSSPHVYVDYGFLFRRRKRMRTYPAAWVLNAHALSHVSCLDSWGLSLFCYAPPPPIALSPPQSATRARMGGNSECVHACVEAPEESCDAKQVLSHAQALLPATPRSDPPQAFVYSVPASHVHHAFR